MAEEIPEIDEYGNRLKVDHVSRMSSNSRNFGSVTDLYGGIDHRHTGSTFPKNTDHQGLVLFSRPMLNLSYDNLMMDRHLLPMAIGQNSKIEERVLDPKDSIHRAIRIMLDPRVSEDENIESNLFDNRSPFINLLTNTLLTKSGTPDINMGSYTSPEGKRKESWIMNDDIAEINGAFDVTANFSNVVGDPITDLFYYWARYKSNVYTDVMVPYPDMIIENRIDYQTRMWRIVLDSTKKYVTKLGCLNACYPNAVTTGSAMNYNREQPFIEDNNQISIPFRCVGAEYNDPILVEEFNELVASFNPQMRDLTSMHKLNETEAKLLNFHGYPRIDPKTRELQWWMDPDEMKENR